MTGVADTIAHSVRIRRIENNGEWDSAVSSLGGGLLQSWSWGEFKARHGWRPTRLLGENDGAPVIAAQVLSRSVGPMSVLYVPRGPVVRSTHSGSAAALTLAIDRIARDNRSAITFIEPEHDQSDPVIGLDDSGWSASAVELQPLRTIKVRVDQSDDDMLAAMKSKSRYNVRLAGRRGVEVRSGSAPDIAAFYELLIETSERDSFGIHSIEYYADMMDVFGESAVMLIAEHEGELAAGALVLQHDDEAIYMFGASSRAHQRHMPTHLLQFEAMRWARERGCRWYDLWGIPATDTPPDEARGGELNVRSGLWGVYRFKQGFGGEVFTYPGVYERQHYPRLVRLWRMFRSEPGT